MQFASVDHVLFEICWPVIQTIARQIFGEVNSTTVSKVNCIRQLHCWTTNYSPNTGNSRISSEIFQNIFSFCQVDLQMSMDELQELLAEREETLRKSAGIWSEYNLIPPSQKLVKVYCRRIRSSRNRCSCWKIRFDWSFCQHFEFWRSTVFKNSNLIADSLTWKWNIRPRFKNFGTKPSNTTLETRIRTCANRRCLFLQIEGLVAMWKFEGDVQQVRKSVPSVVGRFNSPR